MSTEQENKSEPDQHDAWRNHLEKKIQKDWRPTEWDREDWLFTGDTQNRETVVYNCPAKNCSSKVHGNGLCSRCTKAKLEQGLTEEEYIRSGGQKRKQHGYSFYPSACKISAHGNTCPNPAMQSGVCKSHYNQYRHFTKYGKIKVTVKEWIKRSKFSLTQIELDPICQVNACYYPEHTQGLCTRHSRLYKDQKPESYDRWRKQQTPYLESHQFYLGALSETVRLEVLFALQERDRNHQTIHPGAIRVIVRELSNETSILELSESEIPTRFRADSQGFRISIIRDILNVVLREYSSFTGIDETDKDTIDLIRAGASIDSLTMYGTRRRSLHVIDLREFKCSWIRELYRHWLKDYIAARSEPSNKEIRDVLKSALIADSALDSLGRHNTDVDDLDTNDMRRVFEAFVQLKKQDGSQYSYFVRSNRFRLFLNLLKFGRTRGILSPLHRGFSQSLAFRVPPDSVVSENSGKSLPPEVIDTLDKNIHKLDGEIRAKSDLDKSVQSAMFQTMYFVLRDTGRRPGEICDLRLDCLVQQEDESVLIWNNHKAQRFNRRLPILRETADAINEWIAIRLTIAVPAKSKNFLFPALLFDHKIPTVTSQELASALRRWIDSLPENEQGELKLNAHGGGFDKYSITPYAFRHSYAQRHSDAGVPVHILKELMDHRDIKTTQGYYSVSTKKRREATKAVSPFTVNRFGARLDSDPSTYEIRSVAVPYGSCTEPSNVKANGQSCPIRFQCSGCDFFQADPSYLPSLRQAVIDLRSNLAIAEASGAANWVLEAGREEIAGYKKIINSLEAIVESLDSTERKNLEHSAAFLSSARSKEFLPIVDITNSGEWKDTEI